MIDPRNTVILTAGIVTEPEMVADNKILKLRIAIDYAGSEKGAGTTSGYFDVVYYLKDGSDFASKNAGFVSKQVTDGKMKKGSQVQLLGRLVQERWQQDGQNRSKTVIVAEALTYASSSTAPKSDSSTTAAVAAEAKPAAYSVPDEF